MQLPNKEILGKWLFERRDIWQMKLLNASKLGSQASARGLMSFALGRHIKTLWMFGLLHADLVATSESIRIDGLIFVGHGNDNKYYYADERAERTVIHELAGAARNPPINIETDYKLLFHPFRFYALYNIDRLLKTRISPMQILYPAERYVGMLKDEIDSFKSYTETPEFGARVLQWNRICSLSIAIEPQFYQQLFQRLSMPAGRSESEHRQLIARHWNEVRDLFVNIGVDQLEHYRGDLVLAAESLDPNQSVRTLLRFTSGQGRIQNIKGHLGGSMLLLTMAEMLRRGSEDVFARDLPEEDDLRFGPFASKLKLENYGAERILDGDARVEARWLQSFRLGTGVRLRWYVEGYTEFHALKSFFGSCLAIDLVNLRGQIVARGNKLAFRDNLRSDINSMIFSFISFDDDVSDNLRVVRKAAEDDEICGRFFVAEQDFEFDNFTVPELASILWEQARNNGQTIDITRQQLANAVHNATTASEVFSAARRLSNCFYGVDKGESWGRALMEYAVENPHKSLSGSNLEVKRPILEAIGFAIRTSQLEYQPSRANTVVNPATGIPEERLKAKK